MNAQHTPGPWSVLKSDTVPGNHWCVAACGGSADGSGAKVLVVAPIQDYCMAAEDDAALIAAAPALLEALRVARDYAAYAQAEPEDMEMIDAAIRSATNHDG